MQKLLLYTTSGCHLCELAENMLNTLAREGRCSWQPVEISDDDRLIEVYGIRIPVIRKMSENEQDHNEIAWPFSLPELREWLTSTVSG